jgi:flotillin
MRVKANAYKQYGDAAIAALVLDALPRIAAEMSAPLARTGEIVIIGGDNRTTQEVSRLAGTLPPAVQALTGVDLAQVCMFTQTDSRVPLQVLQKALAAK